MALKDYKLKVVAMDNLMNLMDLIEILECKERFEVEREDSSLEEREILQVTKTFRLLIDRDLKL